MMMWTGPGWPDAPGWLSFHGTWPVCLVCPQQVKNKGQSGGGGQQSQLRGWQTELCWRFKRSYNNGQHFMNNSYLLKLSIEKTNRRNMPTELCETHGHETFVKTKGELVKKPKVLTWKRLRGCGLVQVGKMSFCYEYLDELIREFLVFRGFASTLKAFDNELKNEKERSFRPDR